MKSLRPSSSTSTPTARPREAGVMLAAFALWVAVTVLCCGLIVGVANRASRRAAAQSAADAAALAGAAEGKDSAVALAGANGALLIDFVQNGRAVTVRVTRDGVVAVARAEKQIRPAGQG